MALFTKFRKAKDTAAENKTTQGAESATTPDEHIPSRALQDASAPSPTVLRPEELQARIAAAKNRRATSYDPSLVARRAVYHSCDSLRLHSRPNSATGSSARSISSITREKGYSSSSIDALMHRYEPAMATAQFQHDKLVSALAGGPIDIPPSLAKRPRPHQTHSRRSSFTKRKSPLSNMAVEEDSGNISSSSSSSSTASSDTAKTVIVEEDERHSPKVPIELKRYSVSDNTSRIDFPRKLNKHNATRKSRWSFLSKKHIEAAAR